MGEEEVIIFPALFILTVFENHPIYFIFTTMSGSFVIWFLLFLKMARARAFFRTTQLAYILNTYLGNKVNKCSFLPLRYNNSWVIFKHCECECLQRQQLPR